MKPHGQKTYSVAIVGGGIVGTSCAYYLNALGIKDVIQVSPSPLQPTTQSASATARAAGILTPTPLDNFTRYSHHIGAALAGRLWEFGASGLSLIRTQAESGDRHQLLQCREKLRIAVSPMEWKELQTAHKQLLTAGAHTELHGMDSALVRHLGSVVAGVLCEPEGSIWIEPQNLLELFAHKVPHIQKSVTHVEPRPESMRLHLRDRESLEAEMVIVAAHTATASLLPFAHNLNDALVPYEDQWIDIPLGAFKSDFDKYYRAGVSFTAEHGSLWGIFTDNTLRIGGARYLRKWEGVLSENQSEDKKVTAHLGRKAREVFGIDGTAAHNAVASVDCKPCDELPVIGPLSGEPRVLIATGFSGTGFAWGVAAARSLAEIIAYGHTETLPRFLLPDRLRTLPE